jgi:hypothetical protein
MEFEGRPLLFTCMWLGHQKTPVSTRAPGSEARHTVVSGHLFEWGRTDIKLVHKHAECPIIDLLVVLTALDHLGGEVVERAAECGPPVTGRVYAPADLELAVDAEEEILGLDIPVNGVFGMEVGKCVGHLVNVDGAASLGGAAVLCELLIELALASGFEHEKDALLIVKVTVEAEDVWMPEILLDCASSDRSWCRPARESAP